MNGTTLPAGDSHQDEPTMPQPDAPGTRELDWTAISSDPNNATARARARAVLTDIRRIHADIDLMGYVLERLAGKRVLDIGVVEHNLDYVGREAWRHARIAAAAGTCLGVDILQSMVDELCRRGFNVRCVDATSDADLGERFDAVFIGDVIEHVNDPAALLRFAGRHLLPGGSILASTPNPFSRKFIRQMRRDGVMVVNLDHVAWITPTMAAELARRAGLRLAAYHLVKRMSPLARRWRELVAWRWVPAELSFPDYLYEFTSAD